MPRAAVFFAVFLFLFGSSYARIPVDLPEIDDTATPINREYDSFSESRAHPNPTAANTLLLPSENPGTEPATVIHLEPEITDSKPEPESQLEASTESQYQVSASDPSPFTIISFRPINRHIPRRPLPLSYRFGHRCRHNHRFKPWDTLFPLRHIPHGNDMILNKGEHRSFQRVPRGHTPPRWIMFHHVGPRFSRDRNEEFRRPHHHHKQMDQGREGGSMMRVRKFLNQF